MEPQEYRYVVAVRMPGESADVPMTATATTADEALMYVERELAWNGKAWESMRVFAQLPVGTLL